MDRAGDRTRQPAGPRLRRVGLALAGLLVGCAGRLGTPAVDYGERSILPLVYTDADTRRWYVELDGALWFVDTGYSSTTCDDATVQALDLEPRGSVRLVGEVGSIRTTKAEVPPFQLGAHTVSGLVCLVRDLNSTSSIRDPARGRVAGVLGADVLRSFLVTVDPSLGTLTLDPPRAGRAPRSLDVPGVVRLRRESLFGIRPVVRARVDGRPTSLVVDTGATSTHVDGDRLGLVGGRSRRIRVTGTGSVPMTERSVVTYRERSVLLGGQEQSVTLIDRPRPAGRPGLLGLDVLGQFRQIYDFRGRRAWFVPTEPRTLPTWPDGSVDPDAEAAPPESPSGAQ